MVQAKKAVKGLLRTYEEIDAQLKEQSNSVEPAQQSVKRDSQRERSSTDLGGKKLLTTGGMNGSKLGFKGSPRHTDLTNNVKRGQTIEPVKKIRNL